VIAKKSQQYSGGNEYEKIYIPKRYPPTTGYGEVVVKFRKGKIVDCKTTFTHNIEKSLVSKID